MLKTIITVILIILFMVLWIISTRRRLLVLNEIISNSMSQIGIQLWRRYESLMNLLNVTKEYNIQEYEGLIETIEFCRKRITDKSTADDIMSQESVIKDVLARISMITVRYPELRENEVFIKSMSDVEIYDKMVRTSRLIYNDSVSKLNREIRNFPISLLVSILGSNEREYLVEEQYSYSIMSVKDKV